MKKFLKKAEGFTLVELIVVIAILGILAAVAVPAYSGYIEKANNAGDTQVLAAVKTAADAALAADGGDYDSLVVTVSTTAGSEGKATKIEAKWNDDAETTNVNEAKTVVLDGETTATTITSDFDTYLGGNDITLKGKEFKANGATWTLAKGWQPTTVTG